MPADSSLSLGEFFSHWTGVRAGLLETINKFQDDELIHVPFEASRPVGQIMLHIGDAEEGWFRYVVKRDLGQWPEYALDSYPTRAAIKDLLEQIHARTETYLATLTLTDLDRAIEPPWDRDTIRLGWIIWHVLEHEIHHRGELSLILGMLGREGLDV
jgi:uncharacterized damage-inducible protein DinB